VKTAGSGSLITEGFGSSTLEPSNSVITEVVS
jgi:hypothetical protein